MKETMSGRVWRFDDNVDTDQIIPAEYLTTGDAKELARHAFEKVRPEFAEKVRKGDIIVAGENFGCGSSREHAPRALIGAGIACVVASSFARIFYRNAINIGLPVIECALETQDGDTLTVDVVKGTVTNTTRDVHCTFPAYPPFITELINKGGLIAYTKEKLARTN